MLSDDDAATTAGAAPPPTDSGDIAGLPIPNLWSRRYWNDWALAAERFAFDTDGLMVIWRGAEGLHVHMMALVRVIL